MLIVRNLNKFYKSQNIIQNFSFSVNTCERVCLFAPSGAGKSTLIHILAGLDQSFTGTIEDSARRSCTVFQYPALFWYKTVAENIRYPLKLNRIPFDDELELQYQRWMAVTGLAGVQDSYPHQISGGMQQKTALIRAFLPNPDLVLLDEPFCWMDPVSKQTIIAYILKHYPNTSLIMATHALDEIAAMVQRVMAFRKRQISHYETIPVSLQMGLDELARQLFYDVK